MTKSKKDKKYVESLDNWSILGGLLLVFGLFNIIYGFISGDYWNSVDGFINLILSIFIFSRSFFAIVILSFTLILNLIMCVVLVNALGLVYNVVVLMLLLPLWIKRYSKK